jgi:hypothetical protein
MTLSELLAYYYKYCKPLYMDDIYGRHWRAFMELCNAHIVDRKDYVRFTSTIQNMSHGRSISEEDNLYIQDIEKQITN